MPDSAESRALSDLTERAELEALRDVTQRLLNFGGDDTVLMPWVDVHRRHADEPYIGCPFCRDQFVPAAERDRLRTENERLRAGAEQARRLLAAALTGHHGADDAPHVFRRGEVADLEMALAALPRASDEEKAT